MLPFDASMSQSCELDPNCGVITALGEVWKILFSMIGFMALVSHVFYFPFFPFAFFNDWRNDFCIFFPTFFFARFSV